MKIGIDFDNTIASYDTLFHEVALRENFISRRWSGCGKTELRNYLRTQPDGEKTWMKLQGLVYGKYMLGAKLMSGVANFFLSCNVREHKIFIVSHKTEYGHFDPEKFSLRSEALKWMDVRRFFDPEYFGLDRENIFFANTREEKVNIILSTVSLFDKVRKWNKANISNYIEIYIKSDINKIIKLKKKYFYISKSKNVLGKDIKPEFPKFPNIIIENTFKKSVSTLSKELIRKINKIT